MPGDPRPHALAARNRNPLTPQQEKVLARFETRAEAGLPPPTFKELCSEFGWSSTRAAGTHVEALVRKGYLGASQGSGRQGAFVPSHTAYVTERDVANTARQAYGGPRIPVPKYLLPAGNWDEIFTLHVPDSSMAGVGVHQDDIVVVRAGTAPRIGDLVVIVEDGGLVVRLLASAGGKTVVTASPASIKSKRSVLLRPQALRGKVVALMRNYEVDGER